jgi:Pathogenicity locus
MKVAATSGTMPYKLDEADRQSLLQLQRYPGIDGALAWDLMRSGVRSAGQLGHEDPDRLFRSLKQLRGRVDAGLLDTIAAAVHAARTGHEDTSWWK